MVIQTQKYNSAMSQSFECMHTALVHRDTVCSAERFEQDLTLRDSGHVCLTGLMQV